MQYMGGKSRIAKYIAAEINKVRKPGQLVWDAFCGGLSVSVALSKHGPVLSTDANAALINLYKAVQNGWEPPTEVSKETWMAAKSLPDTDPMKAFCGFGCSFGGVWFAGYVSNHGSRVRKATGKLEHQWYHRAASTGLIRDCNGQYENIDFSSSQPRVSDFIIYCDPPYAGTSGYAGGPDFDSDAFIAKIREWSKYVDVFVSEYHLPVGAEVWRKDQAIMVSIDKSKRRTERLYHLPKGSTW